MSWTPPTPPSVKYKKRVFRQLQEISEFIYQLGEYPALREKSAPVDLKSISSQTFHQKLSYLKACFARYRAITGMGRGIAGVQVGIPEQFLIYSRKEDPDHPVTIINPRIMRKASTKYRYPEICMSCNGLVAPVIRPAWIEFTYFDETGAKQYWSLKDDTEWGRMANRIVQHEIDHLNGIMNIDRVRSKDLVFERGTDSYANATFEPIT